MKMLLITDSPDAIIGMRLAGVDTVRVKNPEAAQSDKKGLFGLGNRYSFYHGVD